MALLAQKEAGLKRKLECFALDIPLPVYGGEAMFANGKAIGMTTSGDFGHTVWPVAGARLCARRIFPA